MKQWLVISFNQLKILLTDFFSYHLCNFISFRKCWLYIKSYLDISLIRISYIDAQSLLPSSRFRSETYLKLVIYITSIAKWSLFEPLYHQFLQGRIIYNSDIQNYIGLGGWWSYSTHIAYKVLFLNEGKQIIRKTVLIWGSGKIIIWWKTMPRILINNRHLAAWDQHKKSYRERLDLSSSKSWGLEALQAELTKILDWDWKIYQCQVILKLEGQSVNLHWSYNDI